MHDRRLNIIVGLSGGVDSAVAAYLLKKAGHHVEAVFMKNWEEENTTDAACPIAQDLADAEAVCEKLEINLHMVNFADKYWQHVFSLFLQEYQAGRTPNPDILCNKEIKFKAFLEYAKQHRADYIATGHYVRTRENANGMQLLKGLDLNKDQSYFLYALNHAQISQSLFPVGDLTKLQVRQIAKELGLKNHDKKDSTGICFIGERKFKQFLNEFLPAQPGEIRDIDGEVIGQHQGLMFYTIGQRQGLQIGGKKGRSEQPWYVVDKDIAQNILIVAQGEHPALYKKTLYLTSVHWINDIPALPLITTAKTRYRQADQNCQLMQTANDCYTVTFDQPQRALTPGQSIVFYQNEVCLGGGIINLKHEYRRSP